MISVLAGLLHDILKDTDITEIELRNEFDNSVTMLVKASTKDISVAKENRTEELIKCCVNIRENEPTKFYLLNALK